MKKLLLFSLLSSIVFISHGQIIKRDTSDLTFTGTRINGYDQEYDTAGRVTFSGYIDTYYSSYRDTLSADGYAKFPTSAPKNNQFGLNIAQLSAKYTSNRMRGMVAFFVGDCPKSSWSSHFNYIQEANAGFRIFGKLWLDAGFFRTHIGLESIQPRENITTSASITSYFQTYFMSGAKLTWQQSKKWTFQLHVFNGLNTFIETNKTKALGSSIAYNPTDKWSHTLNTIVCDEYPSGQTRNHIRHYTNYIGNYKNHRFTLGLDGNFAYQQNSQLADSTKVAFMVSGIVAVKYRLNTQWAIYLRAEAFSDPDQMLTGPIKNENHALIGLDIAGGTLGFEFKPIPNAYFRIESRYLRTASDERIFYYNNKSVNYRLEGILSLGVWF